VPYQIQRTLFFSLENRFGKMSFNPDFRQGMKSI